MSETQEIRQQYLTGERALFQGQDLHIANTTFAAGESPLKESRNIELTGSSFKWKYPLWYSRHIAMHDCTLLETARAGIWYTSDIAVEDTVIQAPKTFRRSRGITLKNVSMLAAAETLWNCRDVQMRKVQARGEYFAMNSRHMDIRDLTLVGDYPFDGAADVQIHGAKLLSKDAFWNSENVTVYDSFISGEYLGWNAKDLTLIGCTIESLQGFCYIDHLTLRDCRLLNTTLAFEYSTVDAQIEGGIDSVLNPAGGTICADYIGELIVQPDQVDPDKTRIVCRGDMRTAS